MSKQIIDDYYYGKYGPLNVMINTRTGYVNATHLCGDHDDGADFNDWIDTQPARRLVNTLAASVGIPMDELIITNTGPIMDVCGQYVHPLLAPHVAAWASPEFALRMSIVTDKYIPMPVPCVAATIANESRPDTPTATPNTELMAAPTAWDWATTVCTHAVQKVRELYNCPIIIL